MAAIFLCRPPLLLFAWKTQAGSMGKEKGRFLHGAALLARQAALSIPGYIAFGEVQRVRGTFPTFLELK